MFWEIRFGMVMFIGMDNFADFEILLEKMVFEFFVMIWVDIDGMLFHFLRNISAPQNNNIVWETGLVVSDQDLTIKSYILFSLFLLKIVNI